MDERTIQVNITMVGYQDIADFIIDLIEMVTDYQGKIEFTEDSDVQVEFTTLDEYPSGITLKEYADKELN